MTAKQMGVAIGVAVMYQSGELSFACVVTDAKNAYGQVRVQITPMTGDGSQWVNASSVRALVTTAEVSK